MLKNQIMIDHANKDPRSTSAMLKGNGDGREIYWLEYQENRPHIFDMEYLMQSYAYAIRNGLAKPIPKQKPISIWKFLLIIAGIIFVVF